MLFCRNCSVCISKLLGLISRPFLLRACSKPKKEEFLRFHASIKLTKSKKVDLERVHVPHNSRVCFDQEYCMSRYGNFDLIS